MLSGLVSSNRIFNNGSEGIVVWDFEWGSGSSTDLITLSSNLVYDNGGSGVFVHYSEFPMIMNNTIHGNGDMGILLGGGNLEIKNNIITNNAVHGIWCPDGTQSVSYNNVWNNAGGNYYNCQIGDGEISLDPLFVSSSDFNLQPGESKSIIIPFKKPELKPGTEYRLKLSYRLVNQTSWAEAGHELAWEEFQLGYDVPEKDILQLSSMPELELNEDDDKIEVRGENFKLEFDKKSGIISSFTKNEIKLMI